MAHILETNQPPAGDNRDNNNGSYSDVFKKGCLFSACLSCEAIYFASHAKLNIIR